MMIPNTVRYNVESAGTRLLWPKSPYVHLNMLIFDILYIFFTWNNCPYSMNFGIMILSKINFDLIWYSVIFVWSSDFLSFAFLIVFILVFRKKGYIIRNINFGIYWYYYHNNCLLYDIQSFKTNVNIEKISANVFQSKKN